MKRQRRNFFCFFVVACLSFGLAGCDPDKDLDAYFRRQGLSRVKQLRDDLQPGGLVISVAGSSHVPYYAGNMFFFGRSNSPSSGYPIRVSDGLQKYNAVLPSAASQRSMSASIAVGFLAGYLPAEISSTLNLTGSLTVDLTNVRVFSLDIPTIDRFLSSSQSQAFSTFVRDKLATPGTSAYLIYETYQSTQIRMSTQNAKKASVNAGIKPVVKGSPGGQAKFQIASDDQNHVYVSGDRPYVFAIRTARLLPGAGQTLMLDASTTFAPDSLGGEKYSAPIKGDFEAVEFDSSFPPLQ
jgi:hypothetical protein